jgi:hypothetical protein
MNQHIVDLDNSLAQNGRDAILRRIYGIAPNTSQVDVAVLIHMDSTTETHITGGIAQTEAKVIMSPSEIAAAQWPGGEVADAANPTPNWPRRLDRLIVDGHVCSIEYVDPKVIRGELVRIELTIRG